MRSATGHGPEGRRTGSGPALDRTRAIAVIALAATASGLGVSGSFAPVALYPLSFVALVPVLLATRHVGVWCGGAIGLLAGTVHYLSGFAFLAPAVAAFGDWSRGQGLALLLAFGALHGARWGLFSAYSAWLGRAGGTRMGAGLRALAAASCWVVLERMYPQVFPWYLGSALGPDPILRQAAALGGVSGLSFAVVLVNAAACEAIAPARPRRERVRMAILAAGTVAVLAVVGLVPSPGGDAVDVARVALVQAGRVARSGDPATDSEAAWAAYGDLSRAVRQPVDLVVWPESVLQIYVRASPTWQARLHALVRELRAPILVGALDRIDGTAGELNSAYVVPAAADKNAPEAEPIRPVYYKRRPVPFAETWPSWLPTPPPRWWRTSGDFLPGDALPLIEVPVTRGVSDENSWNGITGEPYRSPAQAQAAVSICYEATLAGWFNAGVRNGAGLLINLTDDSWFAGTHASEQHLEMTRLRAVETRRWLLRASHSGVSAILNERGDIAARLSFATAGTLVHAVPIRNGTTLYVRLGEWVVAGSAAVLLGVAAVAAAARGRCG